jgi:hypothetical protein
MKTEMSDYEKGIFEFFSKPENFKNMLKVASHVEFVKSKALELFWNQVILELNNLNHIKKYSITKLRDIHDYNSRIIIFDNEWPLLTNDLPVVAVGIERLSERTPYWGVWINRSVTSNKPEYYDSLSNEIRKKLLINNFKFDKDNNWCVWKNLNTLDFNDINSFLRILPSSESNNLALEIATEVINYAEEQNAFLSSLIYK